MRRLFISILACLACVMMQAQDGSGARAEREMEATAALFYRNMQQGATSCSASSRMASEQRQPDGRPAWAAYNYGNNDGYVIVAPGSEVPVVLGYARQGSLDSSAMPPALRQWLQALEHQTAQGIPPYTQPQHTQQPAVEPLLGNIQWGEGAPYNDQTPIIDIPAAGIHEHGAVGCVATAMGQVMYYHRWPQQGEGQKSLYHWGQTVTADFDNTTYEWGRMLPTATSEDDPQAINAIATLLLHAGISVDTDYGLTASTARMASAAPALVNYFRYDPGISYRQHNYYTTAEWQQLIDDELTAGRPVMYGGFMPGYGGAAHFYVCDGADGNGYYHINWGWGGNSNGYFLLSTLNPQRLVDDGYDEGKGFNIEQEMITGIQPLQPGSHTHYEVCSGGLPGQSNTVVALGESLSLTITFENNTVGGQPIELYYALTDQEGNTVFTTTPEAPKHLSYSTSMAETSLTLPATLQDGDYRVRLRFRSQDGQTDDFVRIWVGGHEEYRLTVADHQATINSSPSPSISLKGMANNTLVSGQTNRVQLLIGNQGGNYMGNLYFIIKHPVTLLQYTAPIIANVEVDANSEKTIEFDVPVNLPAANDYQLTLYRWEDGTLRQSGVINGVVVTGEPTVPVLCLTESPRVVSEDGLAHRNDLQIEATVANYGTDYHGELIFSFETYYYSKVKLCRISVDLPAGSTQTLSFRCDASQTDMLQDRECDGEIDATDTNLQPYAYSTFKFNVGSDQATSVGKVSTHTDAAPLYDLTGRRLKQKPQKGLYIQNGKKYVVK